MVEGKNKSKMCYAFNFMSKENKHHKRHKIPSYLIEKMKINMAKAISKTHKGKIVSKETRDKISIARTGQPSPNKGKKMSEEFFIHFISVFSIVNGYSASL